MILVGISAYYHDSAVALIVDGEVIAAVAEERLSRKKHDKSFPAKALSFCIRKANITLSDVDYFVFYEKPFVKFERILKTHIQYAPKGFTTFIKTLPIWLKERLNMSRTITKELNKINGHKHKWDIRYIPHHMSHAALAYYTSNYDDAAILIIDAVGEEATTSIFEARNGNIKLIKYQTFPNSVGLLYSAFTYYLGFKVNSDEYKVMGLAPYGELCHPQTVKFISIIENLLVRIFEDGSFIINDKYFKYTYGLEMVDDQLWKGVLGIEKRKPNEKLTQSHMNLAAAIQFVTDKIIFKLAAHIKRITNLDRLCVAGGCGLNCVTMGRLRKKMIFKEIHLPFAPGDDGAAIGAAIYFNSLYNKGEKYTISPYLGDEYSNENILKEINKDKSVKFEYVPDDLLYSRITDDLCNGKIIGWFQGRMEFGPRALGNRSILADPRRSEMKDIVNSKVKFRENFRPFAPIAIQEKANHYFDITRSPYMMFTTDVLKQENIPSVTHVDMSARVQTVTEVENPRIYQLLKSFEKQTGCPILLNTSFNVMGEPIVASPHDALNTFKNSGIDTLVINNFIIKK